MVISEFGSSGKLINVIADETILAEELKGKFLCSSIDLTLNAL